MLMGSYPRSAGASRLGAQLLELQRHDHQERPNPDLGLAMPPRPLGRREGKGARRLVARTQAHVGTGSGERCELQLAFEGVETGTRLGGLPSEVEDQRIPAAPCRAVLESAAGSGASERFDSGRSEHCCPIGVCPPRDRLGGGLHGDEVVDEHADSS